MRCGPRLMDGNVLRCLIHICMMLMVMEGGVGLLVGPTSSVVSGAIIIVIIVVISIGVLHFRAHDCWGLAIVDPLNGSLPKESTDYDPSLFYEALNSRGCK